MAEVSVAAQEGVSTPVGGESAGINVNVWGVIVILLAAAALLYWWACQVGMTGGDSETPRYEFKPNVQDRQTMTSPWNIFGGLDNIIGVPGDLGDMATGHEWRQPDFDCRKNVWSRHRYPVKVGTNLSTLYHKGWSPLMRPAEYDADWMEMPPTEMTIGGYDVGATIAYN